MELSTRGRYAVMAMVELADTARIGPVSLAEIAAHQGLSQCYLEQLFAKLRRAGLVASARGAAGGYRLARPAADLSIAEIMLAVDENLTATRCIAGSGGCIIGAESTTRCRTHELWDRLGRHIRSFLDEVTLADVVQDRMPSDAPRRAKEPA